jgi:hypothetical protein
MSPEDSRQQLDAFKQSAPDNPLANYLSALKHFESSQTDQAIQELVAACGKSKFQDYSVESILGLEEAYRKAGYSDVEAKVRLAEESEARKRCSGQGG